jgi:hypothetical protein
VSEPVNYEDDSRFFVVHEGEVPELERMNRDPSPAPDAEDHSTPTDLDEGA